MPVGCATVISATVASISDSWSAGDLFGIEDLVQAERRMTQQMHRGVAVHARRQSFRGDASTDLAPFHADSNSVSMARALDGLGQRHAT